MDKQIARVNWSRGQFSDVFCSSIINPSPLKPGQKVQVIWGKTRKEYSATISCYPLVEELDDLQPRQDDLQPRKAKAKRKLVNILLCFVICFIISLSELIHIPVAPKKSVPSSHFKTLTWNVWFSSSDPIRCSVPPKGKKGQERQGNPEAKKKKEKAKGKVCIDLHYCYVPKTAFLLSQSLSLVTCTFRTLKSVLLICSEFYWDF